MRVNRNQVQPKVIMFRNEVRCLIRQNKSQSRNLLIFVQSPLLKTLSPRVPNILIIKIIEPTSKFYNRAK